MSIRHIMIKNTTTLAMMMMNDIAIKKKKIALRHHCFCHLDDEEGIFFRISTIKY